MQDWKGTVLAIELWLGGMALALFALVPITQKDYGTASLICAGSLLAFISAVYVREKEKRKAAALSMTGLALVSFCGVAVLFPLFASAKAANTMSLCISSAKQQSSAIIFYSTDYDDRLPPASQWRTSSKVKNDPEFSCVRAQSPFSYAFNEQLSERRVTDVPDPGVQVMVFEAEAYGRDAYGGRDWFARRHGDAGTIGYADGHVNMVTAERAIGLAWLMPPEETRH